MRELEFVEGLEWECEAMNPTPIGGINVEVITECHGVRERCIDLNLRAGGTIDHGCMDEEDKQVCVLFLAVPDFSIGHGSGELTNQRHVRKRKRKGLKRKSVKSLSQTVPKITVINTNISCALVLLYCRRVETGSSYVSFRGFWEIIPSSMITPI
jgi:hypothetical protein